MAKTVDMLDVLNIQEIEGMSTSLLHDHVEKLQEEKAALEIRLEEVYNILEEIGSLDDLEDIEEMQAQIRQFLEEKPFSPNSF